MFLSLVQITALLVLAGGGAADTQPKVRIQSSPLTVSRMDPIVAPGSVGGHTHIVFGASNFRNVLNSPEEQNRAKCTTMEVSADKSNYWTPQLYFINPNGTYTILRQAYSLMYYDFKGDQTVHPFPPGLRMISGSAMVRKPGAEQTAGLSIDFWHYSPVPTNKAYFPNGTHLDHAPDNGQIVTAIHFPRCGLASQALDSDDHFSHMTWPLDSEKTWNPGMGSKCPDTHPIMYPGLFIESFWNLEPYMKEVWSKTGPNVIIANGDVTGLTYHADFVNGWDTNVLQDAINRCGKDPSNVEASGCPAFTPYLHDRKDCRMEGQIPAEEVGITGPLDKLPGCNPQWNWDGAMTHQACEGSKPGYVTPPLDHMIFSVPYAAPGLDDAALLKLQRSPGTPMYNVWGTYDNKSKIPWITPGTQEEVNAAANGGNPIAKIPGQVDASAFSAKEPSPVLPASAGDGNAGFHLNATVICPTNVGYEGFPCTTPAAAPAATGNPGAHRRRRRGHVAKRRH